MRILFKTNLPTYDKNRYYINNRKIKLEVYITGYTGHFVTVTGNAISGTGIEERTDALEKVLEKYMVKPQITTSQVPASGSYLSDASVLTKAVAMCTEFYKPVSKTSAADDFNDLQQTVRELAPAENDRYPWNDIGNGRLFADVFKDIASFVPERKQWFIYDGTRRASDTGSLKTMELCKALANALMRYLAN